MGKSGAIRLGDPVPLVLDYRDAGDQALLRNLSCAAAVGERLWTVADEGRTLECLKRDGEHYALEHQFVLDDLFPSIDGNSADELDLKQCPMMARAFGCAARIAGSVENPKTTTISNAAFAAGAADASSAPSNLQVTAPCAMGMGRRCLLRAAAA